MGVLKGSWQLYTLGLRLFINLSFTTGCKVTRFPPPPWRSHTHVLVRPLSVGVWNSYSGVFKYCSRRFVMYWFGVEKILANIPKVQFATIGQILSYTSLRIAFDMFKLLFTFGDRKSQPRHHPTSLTWHWYPAQTRSEAEILLDQRMGWLDCIKVHEPPRETFYTGKVILHHQKRSYYR